jgi:DNA-binding transcriptional ArsR family regulator
VDSADGVDATALKALGHPLRMELLTFIAEHGEASPVEMSRALDRPLATVSHHTRVLRDAGYVELARTEPRRGAVEHYYRASAAPFLDDEHWESLPIPARRRVSAHLFRRVFKDAAAAGQRGGFDAAGPHNRSGQARPRRSWLARAVPGGARAAQACRNDSGALRRTARSPGRR